MSLVEDETNCASELMAVEVWSRRPKTRIESLFRIFHSTRFSWKCSSMFLLLDADFPICADLSSPISCPFPVNP